jgi:hypothetical protein
MPTVVDHILILRYSPIVVPVANLVEGSYRALIAPRIPPSVPPLILPPLGGGGAWGGGDVSPDKIGSDGRSGWGSCRIGPWSVLGWVDSRLVSDNVDILAGARRRSDVVLMSFWSPVTIEKVVELKTIGRLTDTTLDDRSGTSEIAERLCRACRDLESLDATERSRRYSPRRCKCMIACMYITRRSQA